jgi:hypothetical protein
MIVGGGERLHHRHLIHQHALDLADPMQPEGRFGEFAARHVADCDAQLVRDDFHPELHHLMSDLEEQFVRVDERIDRALAGKERFGVDELLVIRQHLVHVYAPVNSICGALPVSTSVHRRAAATRMITVHTIRIEVQIEFT